MDDNPSASAALQTLIDTLSRLDEEARQRVLKAVNSFFQTERAPPSAFQDHVHTSPYEPKNERSQFSADRSPSPKTFLLDKQPKTDVERIACLAYYLTHFREMQYFKTLDLAKLNTEAAQPKFSNTAYAATNAANLGYLVSGPKGQRQLSAAGEQFIAALPDREAAKHAMNAARPRRGVRRKN
jgi:hypothetical protein